MKKVLINVEERELRVAILEDDQLTELYIESLTEKTILNNVYKGRIEGVIPGLKAAFVNIGMERNAFLHFDDIRPDLLFAKKAELEGERSPKAPHVHHEKHEEKAAHEAPVEELVAEEYEPSDEELETAEQLAPEGEASVTEVLAQPVEGEPEDGDADADQKRRRRRRGRRGGRRRHREQLAMEAGKAPAAAVASQPPAAASPAAEAQAQPVNPQGQQQQRRDKRRRKKQRSNRQPNFPDQQPALTPPPVWPPSAAQGGYGTRATTNPFDVYSPYAAQATPARRPKQRRERDGRQRPGRTGGRDHRPDQGGAERDSQEDFFPPPTSDEQLGMPYDEDEQPAYLAHAAEHEEDEGPAPGNEKYPTEQKKGQKHRGHRGGRVRTVRRRGPSQYAARRKEKPAEETPEVSEEKPKKKAPARRKAAAAPVTEEFPALAGEVKAQEPEAKTPAPEKPAKRRATKKAEAVAAPAEATAKAAPKRTRKKAEEPAKAETPAEKPVVAKPEAAEAVPEPVAAPAASVTRAKRAPKSSKAAPVAAVPEAPAAAPVQAEPVKAVEAPAPAPAQEAKAPEAQEQPAKAKRAPRRRKAAEKSQAQAPAEQPQQAPAAQPEQPQAPVQEVAATPEAPAAPAEAPAAAPVVEQQVTPAAAETTVAPPAESQRRRRSERRRGRGAQKAAEQAAAPQQAPAAEAEQTSAPVPEQGEPVASVQQEVAPTPVVEQPVAPVSVPTTAPAAPAQGQAPQHRRDRHEHRRDRRERVRLPLVTEVFKKGDEVLVQVIKEEIGLKGARISTYISLPGRYLVLLPYPNQEGGVSRKVEDVHERKRLRRILSDISSNDVGFIVRTAGVDREEGEIRGDVEYLMQEWKRVLNSAEHAHAPELVYNDRDILYRLARDVFDESISEILIDSSLEAEKLQDILKKMIPSLVDKVKVYDEPENIFHHFQVEKQIQKAGRRKVWLKSGGYIIIDEAEALTAIDVNTGKFIGKDDQEKMILKTNLEAAKTIARELKLRDIGGLIVVDFIDMKEQRNRDQVLQEFRGYLKRDRSKTSVSSISEFGLVEMTRKRVRQSLKKTLFTDCPYCQGAGVVLNEQQIWLHIKHEILRILEGASPAPSLNIITNPKIRTYIDQNYREALRKFEQKYGCEIRVSMSDVFHMENYAVEKITRNGERLPLPVGIEALQDMH